MKYCIVNGDDFGASPGINRGIVEAHEHGILTSTSLMVNMPGTQDALRRARSLPQLSIGIHCNLTDAAASDRMDLEDVEACEAALREQLLRFCDGMGESPTHIDAHHNIHRLPQLRPLFLELGREYDAPLRENSPVRYFPSFYGRWDGQSHLEHISSSSLRNMLATEFGSGFTELSCHPGYIDADFESDYRIERETELATLCDPGVRQAFDDLGIQRISYRELAPLLRETS